MIAREGNEMEYCSTIIYPNYDYGQPIEIVGMYRPPKTKHPPYTKALSTVLKNYREKTLPLS